MQMLLTIPGTKPLEVEVDGCWSSEGGVVDCVIGGGIYSIDCNLLTLIPKKKVLRFKSERDLIRYIIEQPGFRIVGPVTNPLFEHRGSSEWENTSIQLIRDIASTVISERVGYPEWMCEEVDE